MKSQHTAGSAGYPVSLVPSLILRKGAIPSLLPPRNKRSLLQEGPLSTCDKLLNRRTETPSEGGQKLLLNPAY